MSCKGNCCDHAFAESFFRTLKEELVLQQEYKTCADAKQSIFEYIEVFYNQHACIALWDTCPPISLKGLLNDSEIYA